MFPATLLQFKSPQKAHNHSTKDTIESVRQKASKMVPVTTEDLMEMGSNEILDLLLPPVVKEIEGQFWYRKVSRAPASSNDLMRLQEELDAELLRREAREVGICPIRSELYHQCFEELIRQESIASPERGRLLRMTHLEAQLSLRCAMECYESAVAYGIKKKLFSGKEIARLKTEVTDLLGKIAELDVVRQELEQKLPTIKESCTVQEDEKQKALDAEEDKLKRDNEYLKKEMLEYANITIDTGN